MVSFTKLKSLDFYRKIPRDLTEATVSGAGLSILASFFMILLFIMELRSYLTIATETTVVVDQSPNGDYLRINFNFSFPSLSCEFASVDVNDVLGTARFNLSKTVRKIPIDKDLRAVGPEHVHEPLPILTKHGDDDEMETVEEVHTRLVEEGHATVGSLILTDTSFDRITHEYDVLVVNFYAPWCPWCQRLEPAWEKASTIINQRYDPDHDGRIRLAKIDCTVYPQTCQKHHVQGFPSIRIFRKGTDIREGQHDHESYYGERDTDSLVKFAESLVPNAVIPHQQKHEHAALRRRAPSASGCSINGFVLVKKVPGNLMVSASSEVHSFDEDTMNLTHWVHELSFGRPLSMRKRAQVDRLVPHLPDVKDRVVDHVFVSHHDKITHEHFLQVVKTEVVPLRGLQRNYQDHGVHLFNYDYTVHSHTLQTLHVPVARFHYELSPMQVLITEVRRPFFHFITYLCAIIGGVFTVAGILDGMLHGAVKIVKKTQMGKQF